MFQWSTLRPRLLYIHMYPFTKIASYLLLECVLNHCRGTWPCQELFTRPTCGGWYFLGINRLTVGIRYRPPPTHIHRCAGCLVIVHADHCHMHKYPPTRINGFTATGIKPFAPWPAIIKQRQNQHNDVFMHKSTNTHSFHSILKLCSMDLVVLWLPREYYALLRPKVHSFAGSCIG